MTYLAGLQRVRYVFVYPEQQDIVLVGPAEGWKMDGLGNVVGRTTNRPVLMLDDLMIALRSGAVVARRSRSPARSIRRRKACSGCKSLSSRLRNDRQPRRDAGDDRGGPRARRRSASPACRPRSHFARTMVAADFRMKRLAMNFEPAPVDGMPSFLSMIPARGRGMNNMMPRWWLAPNYEPLAKTADGLAWELRGPGVKCLTEEDYVERNRREAEHGQGEPRRREVGRRR